MAASQNSSPDTSQAVFSVEQAAKSNPRRLMATVLLFGVSVLSAIFATLGLTLYSSRQQAIEAGHAMAATLAHAASDSTSRLVQSVDVVLISAAEMIEKRREIGDPAVDLALTQRLQFSPQFRQLIALDMEGRVLFDTAGAKPGTRIDISGLLDDRKGSVRPLAIGRPLNQRYLGAAQAEGQSIIPFSRGFGQEGGREEGVIVAAVNPLYFHALFDAFETSHDGQVGLYRFDGAFLSGTPGKVEGDADELLHSRLKTSEFGTFEQIGSDGENLIHGYRTTLVWPLVVSIGLSENSILAKWRQDTKFTLLVVALLGIILLGLTVVLSRLLFRRIRDDEALVLSDMALSNVADGVAITDSLSNDNPVVYVNPAFQRITGYLASEVIGRNLRFLHGDDDAQEGLAKIRKGVEAGGGATAVLRNYRKDGKLFWNELTITAIADSSGRTVHYVGVQRDITQRVENENRLRQSLEEAALANEELERFSEILAHHLQEPVKSLAIFTQLLGKHLGSGLDDKGREYSAYITTAAVRLRSLLRDVQLYLSASRHMIEPDDFDSQAALDAALSRLSDLMAATGGRVTSHGMAPIRGDFQMLVEIFFRLIENALSYARPAVAPDIYVTCSPIEDGFLRFCVRDNGIGIAPEFRERVFRVFERLSPSSSAEGTGIGLSLVKKLVTQAGGTVSIEGAQGGGTQICFTLPSQPAD